MLRLGPGQGEPLLQPLCNAFVKGRGVLQPGVLSGGLLRLGDQGLHRLFRVLQVQDVLHRLDQQPPEHLAVGLGHPLGHAVVKVGDGLAAVLVVLVGLDGDGRQGGVALDALGLPEIAVAGGKAPMEQLQNVDLAAGGGQGVEVDVYKRQNLRNCPRAKRLT